MNYQYKLITYAEYNYLKATQELYKTKQQQQKKNKMKKEKPFQLASKNSEPIEQKSLVRSTAVSDIRNSLRKAPPKNLLYTAASKAPKPTKYIMQKEPKNTSFENYLKARQEKCLSNILTSTKIYFL